ncbi:esterase [Bacillus sp. V3-13]|uniref:prolyl oligopeptidase family serine peptidase n=1 Tax=Bacillus sp. V3-13 TaxID=2053728 RepID=UPI000C75CF1E|nr:prolyl oligopeptidase family serine peptidase [Bacillus sp. V3-13]PLR78862.1 esterase [Bacillus sp. V3-13]
MVIVENLRIGSIPALHLVQQEESTKKLPFVIFVHGFTSAKENNLHYGYLLAQKGFRVVLPETIHHGERAQESGETNLNFRFWDIVLNTIEELNTIKEYYERQNYIDVERIGLAGTSMGAIITLGALTKYSWIKAAVSLMGMPYYEKFALAQLDEMKKRGIRFPFSQDEIDNLFSQLREYDLSVQPEKLEQRPLLFWHGQKDPVVPYKPAYNFYQSIKPAYQNAQERLKFISDEKAEHKVSMEGITNTVKWFEAYL